MRMDLFKILLLGIALCCLSSSRMASFRPSKDYALFFAVSNYKNSSLTNLPNSIPDARAIAEVLEKSYGFKTEVIADPTLDVIEQKLNEYRDKFAKGSMAKDGQLLIFFSGHGVKEYENGYFLPADADPARLFRTAVAYNIWRPIISEIQCQHILVAVDACYSVTFDPSWESKNDPKFQRIGELSESERILENHKAYKNRIFFTADAKENTVPGRSNFARKLLEGLLANQYKGSFITSTELFANFVQKAQPAPRANHFEGDDPNSSFLFFPTQQVKVDPQRFDLRQRDIEAFRKIQQSPTVIACQQYLTDFLEGNFRGEVTAQLLQLQDEQEWQFALLKNTTAAYENYLRLYPNGKYTTEARSKISQPTSTTQVPPAGARELELPDFVFVKGGTFQMGDQFGDGSVYEKPVHSVTMSDFYMGIHEVTFEEYDAFCVATRRTKPSDNGWGRDKRPVINVHWYDAVEYCNWRSKQEGLQQVYTIEQSRKDANNKSSSDDVKWTVTCNWAANGYRLPTEAEWEYAARGGGKKVRFGNGQDIARASQINFDASASYKKDYSETGTYRSKTVEVGSLNSPNALGLHDMSGNVWEWCWDWYGDKYYGESSNSRDPRGPTSGQYRVVRGGSWNSNPNNCRAADRSRLNPSLRDNYFGFRLVRH